MGVMKGSGAALAEDVEFLGDGALSAEDHALPSTWQGARRGRWAAGLGATAAIAMIVMGVILVRKGGLEVEGSSPSGPETTGSLGATTELAVSSWCKRTLK